MPIEVPEERWERLQCQVVNASGELKLRTTKNVVVLGQKPWRKIFHYLACGLELPEYLFCPPAKLLLAFGRTIQEIANKIESLLFRLGP